MSKVTVVGAGNVGATCADVMASRETASEIVLIDVKEGLAEGKALDISQTSPLRNFDTVVTGCTSDYSKTAGSDVIVITSGIPRKPGMTREELIGVNASIVKEVVTSALKYSPDAIFIIVSNPMDTMTYLAKKVGNLPFHRILGMGGILDSSRFRYYLAHALGANINDVDGMVIGGHGDTTMIPLVSKAACKGIPISDFLKNGELEDVLKKTMVGGATLTGFLGTSAWYAPGAAIAQVVEAILNNENKVIPTCVALDGQYGQKDICIGVPAVISRKGVDKILEINLTEEEKEKFAKSADAVRKTNDILYQIGALQ